MAHNGLYIFADITVTAVAITGAVGHKRHNVITIVTPLPTYNC